MFVYLKTEPRLWTVGHYDLEGKFISESDHASEDEAADRVAFLNGGGTRGKPGPVEGLDLRQHLAGLAGLGARRARLPSRPRPGPTAPSGGRAVPALWRGPPMPPLPKEPIMSDGLMLLPPAPGKCPLCAEAHRPELPHDHQSLYWGTQFLMRYGRQATWADSMAHCTEAVRAAALEVLAEHNIHVTQEQIDEAVKFYQEVRQSAEQT